MSFTVVIPARYASQRLPGKPLLPIAGKPMIEHVVNCAQKSAASRIIVATDDERIADAVTAFGGDVCMTSSDHPSGTDRLQEVAKKLGLGESEVIVNVQGDEPMIPAEVINQVAHNLIARSDVSAATLCEPVESFEDALNPNIVKVVTDNWGKALYFSRAPIPWCRDTYKLNNAETGICANVLARRHIGIYAYRVKLLQQFVQWPMAALESIEKLEQLRILANGCAIHVEDACVNVPGGVDTESDLQKIRALMTK